MSVAWPGSGLGTDAALINLGFWLSLFSKKGGEVGTRGDQSLWKAKILQSKVNLYLDVFLQNKDNVDGVSTFKARAGGINPLQGTLISHDSLTWTLLVSGAG